jgi:FlaA1/EpsC-like NDP-sugar epimerase
VRHPRPREPARVFERAQPEVVFHAAALKHLTMLERHPGEAFKTNVVGTLNVLEAARAVGVTTFVNISTDKAARPTCVLGWSKRVAERLTAGFNEECQGRYVSVRFGNVLGSRGSVVLSFMEQIRKGGPVTVTDPDVERYFMLIPEACQLVLQAGAIGTGGEVMVLDMGSPVKIVDVAKTMIDLSGSHRHRHRLHRSAPRGEAHRRALHPRRGDPALVPPPHLAGVRAGTWTPVRSTERRLPRRRRDP